MQAKPTLAQDHSSSDSLDDIKVDFSNSIQNSESFNISNQPKTSFLKNIVDSFKKADPKDNVSPTYSQLEEAFSVEVQNEEKFQRNIKPRHMFLVSIGTGVGTGMLVSTGSALRQAGPANLLIAYCIVSSFVYTTYNSISELAVIYKDLPGSYNDMFRFLIDPAFSFATVIVYGLNYLCVMPLELVTSSLLIRFWTTKVNADIFVICFYCLIIGINMIGGKGFAEFEFIVSSIKMIAVISFLIYGLIKDVGGTPNQSYIGGKYWKTPGAFTGDDNINRFKGLCVCFVFACFSYGGFEVSVLLSSVVEKPVFALKKARKMMLYRIFVIYFGIIIFIGLLVPYTNDKLLGGGNSASDASPLIIAVSNVKVYPHILNAVILLSVLSVANCASYTSTRILHSLFNQFCPHPMLTYIDRQGRPLTCMLISAIFALLSFFAAASFRVVFFNWLLALSGLSVLFVFFGMNMAHIRFRKAMKLQGRSLNELAFISPTGVIGSYWGVLNVVLIFIAQFWVALVPIGTSLPNATSFFQNYLCAVLWIICYLGYKIYKKSWRFLIPADEIDIDTGRTIFDHEVVVEEENEHKLKIKNSGILKRVLDFWC
ncbi:hypothetical protein QEN19_002955 [Hanseniaspora menglaensis]